jgi:hypothetical protein
VVVQASGVAAVGNGVEVEVKGFRLGEQQRRQFADPGGQECLLVRALGAVRIVGGESFLGQDVETGKESERLSKLKSLMWLRRSLSRSFRISRLSKAWAAGTIFEPG